MHSEDPSGDSRSDALAAAFAGASRARPRTGRGGGRSGGARRRLAERVAPPAWLVNLLRSQPAPIPAGRVIRAAVGIATPVGVGLATGHLAEGMLVSAGATGGVLADRDGPYRHRARQIGCAVVAAGLGFLLGGLTADVPPWLTVGVVASISVVSALVSAMGSVASLAGLTLLVYTVLGSGLAATATGPGPVASALLIMVGGALILLLSLAGWLRRGKVPEQEAVTRVYLSLGDLLAAVGTDRVGPARLALTAALNDAYDALLGARTRFDGPVPAFHRLFALLNAAAPLVESSAALIREGHRLPPEMPAAVTSIARSIRTGGPPPVLPATVLSAGGPGTSPGLRAFAAGLRTVEAVTAGAGEEPPGGRARPARIARRWSDVRDAVIAGPATWIFAARLGLCMAVAQTLSVLLPLHYSYWVPLTVAMALKPDFGSVFARAVQRGVGTVVGVLIGALVEILVPKGPLLVIVVAVLAGLLPIGLVRNYGMFTAFVTPLVIVQFEVAHGGDWDLVASRLVDTLLGCAVVLIGGYLLWPRAWRPQQVGERFACAVETVAAYVCGALGPNAAGRSALRRQTYRTLSDLRTTFQRALTEPSPAGRTAAAWWPGIVALERTTDAVTAVAVSVEHGGPPSGPGEAERLGAVLRDVAGAVRSGQSPLPLVSPLPEQGPLAGLAAEISTIRHLISGPAPDAGLDAVPGPVPGRAQGEEPG